MTGQVGIGDVGEDGSQQAQPGKMLMELVEVVKRAHAMSWIIEVDTGMDFHWTA